LFYFIIVIHITKLMKLLLYSFAFLFYSLNSNAQQTITTTGGNSSGSGGSISYSVGQTGYKSNSGTTGSLNAGVQQPYEFYHLGINEVKEIRLYCSVFPNPTQANVILKIDFQNLENLSYTLTDVDGKLINSQKIISKETVLPMQNLSSATYFLSVLNSNKQLQNFKIIKTN